MQVGRGRRVFLSVELGTVACAQSCKGGLFHRRSCYRGADERQSAAQVTPWENKINAKGCVCPDGGSGQRTTVVRAGNAHDSGTGQCIVAASEGGQRALCRSRSRARALDCRRSRGQGAARTCRSRWSTISGSSGHAGSASPTSRSGRSRRRPTRSTGSARSPSCSPTWRSCSSSSRGGSISTRRCHASCPNSRLEIRSRSPITLRQLMSHRSGLVREPPVGHYFDPSPPPLHRRGQESRGHDPGLRAGHAYEVLERGHRRRRRRRRTGAGRAIPEGDRTRPAVTRWA